MSNPLQAASDNEILSKLYRYCSYQERCEMEVRKKMKSWEFQDDEKIDEWIVKIKELELIDDQRFCKLYAVGRFRLKKWGRIKIRYHLKGKGLSDEDIQQGLENIPEEEYTEILVGLIHQKNRMVKAPDIYQRRHKIFKYLVGKGFEPDLIWKALREEIS